MRMHRYETWKRLIYPGRRGKVAFGCDEKTRDCQGSALFSKNRNKEVISACNRQFGKRTRKVNFARPCPCQQFCVENALPGMSISISLKNILIS